MRVKIALVLAAALALACPATAALAGSAGGPWRRVGNPVYSFEAPAGWKGQCQTPHALCACTFYQKDARGRWLHYLELNPESPGKPTTLEGFVADWLALLARRHPGHAPGKPTPIRMGPLPAIEVQAEFTSGFTGQRLRQRLAFAQAGPDLYLVLDYQAPPETFAADLPVYSHALASLRLAGMTPPAAQAAPSAAAPPPTGPARGEGSATAAAPPAPVAPSEPRPAASGANAPNRRAAQEQAAVEAATKRAKLEADKQRARAEAARRARQKEQARAAAEAANRQKAQAQVKRREQTERLRREAAAREVYRQARLDFTQGVDRFNAGDYDQAAELFTRFLRVFPNDGQGRRLLAMAREQQRALRSGSLKVESVPPGRVYLDGRPVGNTPLTLPEVPVGRRRVEVRAGGRSQSKLLDIKGRTATTVSFDLRLRQVPEGELPAQAPAAAPAQAPHPAPASGPAPAAAGQAGGQIAGYVLEAQDGHATIDLGRGRGVVPGMRFEVLEVTELVHPVSGKHLRKFTRRGLLEVTSVQEQVSLARVLEGAGAVAPGQALRPVAGPR